MSQETTKKILEILIETERIGDKTLQLKEELIALDRQRQQMRQAVRAVEKSTDKNTLINVGAILMKFPKQEALDLLNKDLAQIEIEINTRRSQQKELVGQYRDAEFLSQPQGKNLKPLSAMEMGALKANLPTINFY